MAHIVVPEAEAILDKEFPVLDQGFVRLVDYLGGDARIVQSARVSYGEGTTTFRRDRGLIRYLMEHQHTSPFEQVILTFHAKMPIFVARQWIRHRTARLNEISGRYSVMKEEFYVPEAGDVRYQSETNRQGRSAEEVPPELQQKVIDLLKHDQAAVYANYQQMIDDGIARELARINLPLSLYTEWYWQIDLHNLFHFLELRRELHAQWEIRQYADRIYEITKAVAPVACEAFEDFVLHGVRFSKREIEVIRDMLDGKTNPLSGYELREFERKLYGKHTDEA
jgi:thymidylate synthase (FAD)